MVGQKDMDEDPRFSIGKLKSGAPTYFQDYSKNKNKLQSYDKHGYLIVAPHVSINIPNFGEMSGTAIRNAIASANTVSKRKELFPLIFGWYDAKIADMLFDRFSSAANYVPPPKKTKKKKLTEGGEMFDVEVSKVKRENLDSTIQNVLDENGLIGVKYSKIGNFTKPLMGDIDIAIDTSDMHKIS